MAEPWTPTPRTARLVAAAAEQWRRGLLDVSGGNRRLHYRPLAVATLDLAAADPHAVRRLLCAETVTLTALFPHDGSPETVAVQARARRAADALWRRATEAEEETGANPARLAVGAVTFEPPQAGGRPMRAPKAPLVLLPVRFTPVPGTRSVAALTLDGEPELNWALRAVLRAQHGADLDEEALLAAAEPDAGGALADPAFLAAAASGAVRGEVPGWQVLPHLAVDCFGSDRELMLRDLEDEAALAASPVVAALAGDGAAQVRVAGEPLPPVDRDRGLAAPDRRPPAEEFLVLDADASQQRVVDLALAGRNLVVQGPPGTGKSQTIANLVAAFAAEGCSVLVVAQKRAAIEAVTGRLQQRGLGHLLLEVFDAGTRRSSVLTQLAGSLQGLTAAAPVDAARLHATLADARALLVEHRDAVHRPRTELGGGTVAELVGRLHEVPPEAQTQDRLAVASVARWGPDGVERHAARLEELTGLGAFEPWWHEQDGWDPRRVVTEEDAVTGRDAAVSASATVVRARATAFAAAREAGMAEPAGPGELTPLVALLTRAAQVAAAVDPALLDPATTDDATLRRLAVATGGDADGAGEERLGWLARRRVRPAALRLTRSTDAARAAQLLQEVADLRRAFRGAVGVPAATGDLVQVHARLREELATLRPLVRGIDPDAMSWDELAAALRGLVGDPRRARMPRAHALAEALEAAGVAPVTTAIAERYRLGQPVPAREAGDRLRWAALSTMLDHLTATDPALSRADRPSVLAEADAVFRAADRQAVQVNAARVARAAGEAALQRLAAHPEQQRYLQAELTKKRRLRSLRELVDRAPEAVLAAAPCWAMSPLLVSRYLPALPLFDVVVYDEASQVTVPDAIPSMLRGRQVVVAGDDRQLPPTTVFTTLLDGGDPDDAPDDAPLADAPSPPAPVVTTDHASVLTALSAILPTRTLLWHYRSRDERLIATSNAHVYGGRLVTFPGPQSDRALRHVVVPPSPGLGPHDRSPQAEVARVVRLCLEHADQQRGRVPSRRESLGVIATGSEHAARIETALFDAVLDSDDPYLAEFFDGDAAEPFFVKNIERVQGDERDHVVLSIGYGPSADGRMRFLWGPLLGEHGVNRLNVAISRARTRMTLVTSFTAEQLPPGASASPGYQLLRRFVQFAAAGGQGDAGGAGVPGPAPDAFERDVRERLVAAGLTVDARYGVGGYRIDLAVRHPDDPSSHVLAIETDGVAYASGWTARERDRLRREHLEALGWRFHRLWAADYWRDPDAEIADVLASVHIAVDRLAEGLPAADGLLSEPAPPRPPMPAPPLPPPTREAPEWITTGRPIGRYSDEQLADLVRWLREDGALRLPDDELKQLMTALGFVRRSAAIVARLEQAMRAAAPV